MREIYPKTVGHGTGKNIPTIANIIFEIMSKHHTSLTIIGSKHPLRPWEPPSCLCCDPALGTVPLAHGVCVKRKLPCRPCSGSALCIIRTRESISETVGLRAMVNGYGKNTPTIANILQVSKTKASRPF
jgi:hypothetical protein